MVGEFLGLFKQQPIRLDNSELDTIKKDLKKQEEWIRQLHKYSNDLHKYTVSIKDSNIKHKGELVENINGISRWIEYLNNGNIELKKELNDLKISMRKALRSDFEVYHKTLIDYIALKLNEEQAKKDVLKEEIIKDMKKEIMPYLEERRKQGITNADNEKKVNNAMHYMHNVEFSNPEKELLNLFFNEGKPLTYEAIARKLNKSVNTIRVYMNSLRSKKDIVDEFLTPTGSKVFSLKNSELVKTLFNLN